MISDDEADIIIAAVEQIRRERDSGAGIDLTAIDYLSWRLVMIYDAAVESEERNLKLYAKDLFAALAARSIQ